MRLQLRNQVKKYEHEAVKKYGWPETEDANTVGHLGRVRESKWDYIFDYPIVYYQVVDHSNDH